MFYTNSLLAAFVLDPIIQYLTFLQVRDELSLLVADAFQDALTLCKEQCCAAYAAGIATGGVAALASYYATILANPGDAAWTYSDVFYPVGSTNLVIAAGVGYYNPDTVLADYVRTHPSLTCAQRVELLALLVANLTPAGQLIYAAYKGFVDNLTIMTDYVLCRKPAKPCEDSASCGYEFAKESCGKKKKSKGCKEEEGKCFEKKVYKKKSGCGPCGK